MAYWNVRTLQGVGVQALTMRELRKYNVDIACLSEVRIPDSCHSVIKVMVRKLATTSTTVEL